MTPVSKYIRAESIMSLMDLSSPDAAKNLMKRWGVQPYYLGPGRGLGWRYLRSEVEDAIEDRKSGREKPKAKAKPRAKEPVVMLDELSVADMYKAVLTPRGRRQ